MGSVKTRQKVAKAAKPEKDESETLGAAWREICRKQKGLMVAMILLIVASAALLIFALTTAIRPQNTVVIVGYGDVYGELSGISGGYRRDSWANMLAFPILAALYGVVHNLIALRVYRKYGTMPALAVVAATGVLIVGTIVVMVRLLGEW